jgi:aminoglycoside phosphotransferase (APT) family kinase protein
VSWLRPVGRRLGGTAEIVARTPLAGGYASSAERVDLLVAGEVVPVVVKPAAAVEVAALRAVAVVEGARVPRLLHPDPLVMTWVEPAEPDLPGALATLHRVHEHWSRNRPRGIPVVDAPWWQALCARTAVSLRGNGFAADEVEAWATDERIRRALAVLPKTLCHGDPHRGNLLGDTVIDWGNARVAPAGLDLAVVRAQGGPDLLSGVEREWAWLHVHVQYLGFAADHLGSVRVAEMLGEARGSLSRLGAALQIP